jgi:D-tyrosyl-tRNA(Tyr) deacylase
MRALVQRVSRAAVVVEGVVVGEIGRGLLVFVCAMRGDSDIDVDWLVQRLTTMRVFPDEAGRLAFCLTDTDQGGNATDGDPTMASPPAGILVVSQFTLSADLRPGLAKGTRPSFSHAADPLEARARIDQVVARLQALLPEPLVVRSGSFGAHMSVDLVNDGPLSLWLDTRRISPESQ